MQACASLNEENPPPGTGRRASGGASRLDVLGDPRLVGVDGERLRGGEVKIPLHRKAETPAHSSDFRETDAAHFGRPEAQIAEAEGDAGIDCVIRSMPVRDSGILRYAIPKMSGTRFRY